MERFEIRIEKEDLEEAFKKAFELEVSVAELMRRSIKNYLEIK